MRAYSIRRRLLFSRVHPPSATRSAFLRSFYYVTRRGRTLDNTCTAPRSLRRHSLGVAEDQDVIYIRTIVGDKSPRFPRYVDPSPRTLVFVEIASGQHAWLCHELWHHICTSKYDIMIKISVTLELILNACLACI